MRIRSEEIASVIAKEIENYEDKLVAEEVGTVMEVGDGIARIYGLQSAMAGEMLEFENGAFGLDQEAGQLILTREIQVTHFVGQAAAPNRN